MFKIPKVFTFLPKRPLVIQANILQEANKFHVMMISHFAGSPVHLT